jgi:DNA-binding beta-propeller fold protein YncE
MMLILVKRINMKCRQGHKLLSVFECGMVLAAFITAGGCSHPAGVIFTPQKEPLVWPQPPEEAKVRYVGLLSTEEDLRPAVSWSQGLNELFFGKEDIGVLVSPTAVLYDNEKIYVTDSSAGVFHTFDLRTRGYQQTTAMGLNERLMMPVAITFMDQNICITDSVLKKVCVFDKSGVFRFAFGQDILKRPSGVAFLDSNKKLYVVDTANHKINVFDSKGNWLFEFGSRGIGPGQFNFPTHLWVDKDGKVYVSDTLNYRIQIFSSKGIFLRMFGAHGDRPGSFAHPAGIATDSEGHVYVVDKQYENVQIFDNNGNILMAFGAEGTGPGDFWLPSGIFISDDDRIYVADSFNKRIQVFDYLKVQSDDEE